jgi:hypothetical protein
MEWSVGTDALMDTDAYYLPLAHRYVGLECLLAE